MTVASCLLLADTNQQPVEDPRHYYCHSLMTFFTLRTFAMRANKLRDAGLVPSAGLAPSATSGGQGADPCAQAPPAAEGCTFCAIASGQQDAHVVYSDDDTVAFLDVYPIRAGHTLVVPRAHCEMLSHLSPSAAGALGQSVSRVAKAIGQALGDERLQVCANQVHAQTVPHAHYHIVPAPPLPGTKAADEEKARNANSQWFLTHGRKELDDEELADVANKIRKNIVFARSAKL